MMITSTSNPTVKHIRKLMDRKERQLSGLFYLEGLRIVGEAIQSGWEIEMLVVCQPLLTSLFGQQVVQGFIQQGFPPMTCGVPAGMGKSAMSSGGEAG